MKIVTYIISDIDKALAFEWIAEHVNSSIVKLNFILIVEKPSALEKFLLARNMEVHTYYYRSKKDFPQILLKLYLRLKKDKPHIIHCHLLYGSLIGLTAAWLAGIRTRLYTRHHSDFHQRFFPSGIKWDNWCNKISTRIIAPSGIVKDVLTSQEQVDPGKVTVIHHGFDFSYFTETSEEMINKIRNKYNPVNGQPVIGVISRFTEWKGIQFIIPAFQKLLSDYPNAILMLFNAQGDYEKEIRLLLNEIPENNVKLIKFEPEISACYQLFDIFIHTPLGDHVEAFGQIYVEALAVGIPSIFTLSGIAIDFIEHEKNALVVPYCNSDEIYHAMLRILNDEELRKKLITEGWNSVKERFALQHMIKQLEDLYEKG